ncbi:alpha-galactosidase [Mucilaginibacter pallidiroseus]|uniref:Alpha-galactosidase n=1 Tax=Mucilaginibacter pallidiroseus TaxID=2599295 RepID=A0A563UIC7_9SPHI|nr:alpha-galactosidase [Mucilaginibacter pallidiroseus]TWR31115.1 alpha-galactosidase [Mucilaginibacter pallidiroseus]
MLNLRVFALLMICALLDVGNLRAQTIIPIETNRNALVLQVAANKDVNVIYFGKKLGNVADYALVPGMYKQAEDYTSSYNSAYTPAGSRNLLEPAIAITHADGNQSLDLKYVSHSVKALSDGVSQLSVVLKDPVYNTAVTLYYKAYFATDVIEQWCTIKNLEKGDITLQKFASANLYLKGDNYWLKQYHGDWAKEMRPEESKLTHGIKTLDTKLGTRANIFQPSVFMVSLGKPATEDEGSVLYGGLEWSSNFKIDFEVDPQDNLRIIAGINNHPSSYKLKASQEFTTPAFWYVLGNSGKGDLSRKVHNWARNYKILDGNGQRRTLLNNWEATFFDFNESRLFELLKDTKKLGVDLFLLDDGWFANKYPRNSDHTGLGDWQENKQKLPNGISSLVKEAQQNGVKFGIWVEPEMVSPKSELYEKHPDWVIKQPKREEYYFRNQLVLDLSNPKVQDFVFGVVDGLFAKNPALAYIKWDCNAVIYNAYSAYLKKDQSQFYVDYTQGLYNVLERLRGKYPTVPMMLCSGGGGRVDYAALQYFTEYWPSDNTDPLERIFIQWDYSYFYPAIASANHVTDWGKQPIKFRTDVAMMGKLGFDIVVSKLGAADLAFCQQAIKNYDAVKDIIWHGDQFRLASPYEGSVASFLYMNKAKASGIMFSYLVNNRYGEKSALPIKITGLDTAKKYRLTEINLYDNAKTSVNSNQIYSGDFLTKVGFNPDINTRRTSVVLKVEEVK